MAGGKRNKLKKAPAPVYTPPSDGLDDSELVDDLLAQLDARDATVQQESAKVLSEIKTDQEQKLHDIRSKVGSKSRYKARELRRAAARVAPPTLEDEAASERLRQEAEEEQSTIRGICDARGLEIYEINPDGHCLFAAVADQLAILSIIPVQSATYHTTRHAAADYIETHPDDFLPFLLSMDGNDTGRTDGGLMSPQDFQQYCATIRDTGAWGGEPEILAMARAFCVPIHVVQWGTPSVVVHSPNPGDVSSIGVVRVSYHRRMYGLGEHYNSLRARNNHLPGKGLAPLISNTTLSVLDK